MNEYKQKKPEAFQQNKWNQRILKNGNQLYSLWAPLNVKAQARKISAQSSVEDILL